MNSWLKPGLALAVGLITNVNDDGTIPAAPAPNWVKHNNYRSGDLSPPDGTAAPDLRVKTTVCQYGCSDAQLML